MNQTTIDNIYTITIPPSADAQLMEWFDFMSAHGNLSAEIIKLVSDHINSISCAENVYADSCAALGSTGRSEPNAGLDDLFVSLYNCQASSNAIFFEEKKQKRKMLSV